MIRPRIGFVWHWGYRSMDRTELVVSARLQRERAQKAQYTAMILREWASETRARYRALRLALQARSAAQAERTDEPPAEAEASSFA
jgi:hypothetical protein